MTEQLAVPFRKPRTLPPWTFVRLVREPDAVSMAPAKIRGPGDVQRLLAERTAQMEQEAFYVICPRRAVQRARGARGDAWHVEQFARSSARSLPNRDPRWRRRNHSRA